MRLRAIIPFVALLSVAGFLFWWFSDAQVIKRKTHNLAGIFTVKATDGNASRVTKNNALSTLLTMDFSCELSARGYSGTFGKDELKQAHVYLSKSGNTSSVTIGKWELSELSDTSAKVTASFSVNVHMKNQSPQTENVIATIHWLKNKQGRWMIQKIISEEE